MPSTRVPGPRLPHPASGAPPRRIRRSGCPALASMPRELRASATNCRSFGGHRFGPAEAPYRHKRYGLLRSVRRRKRSNGFVRTARRGGEASSIRAARCVPQATTKRHRSHTRDRFLRPANHAKGAADPNSGSERFGNRPPRCARPRTVPMAGRRSAPDCRQAVVKPQASLLVEPCCQRAVGGVQNEGRLDVRPLPREVARAGEEQKIGLHNASTPSTESSISAETTSTVASTPAGRRPNGKQTVRPVDSASGRPPCDRDPAPDSPPAGKACGTPRRGGRSILAEYGPIPFIVFFIVLFTLAAIKQNSRDIGVRSTEQVRVFIGLRDREPYSDSIFFVSESGQFIAQGIFNPYFRPSAASHSESALTACNLKPPADSPCRSRWTRPSIEIR